MGMNEEFLMVGRTASNIMHKSAPEWNDFWVPIMNNAQWDQPNGMRIGQRVMNALTILHPEMGEKITAGPGDVWEVTSGHDQNWEIFWSKVFEMFVEEL